MSEKPGITAKKEKEFSEWYTQAVLKSELADYSSVKGCMVIRPLGYAVWEKIRDYFDARIKLHSVKNAYFPLFIPESFFKKEAQHAEGFRPEVAWIANRDENSEQLAIRPTSETVMYDSFSRWVRSWRDLPLKINQWCNVVRWETKAVKLFLRTREFLWQEGHCVYATREEAEKETKVFMEEYKKLCEELLAIPVVCGIKTEKDKFAGAVYTTTVEALMPDGKALQMGTSHNLGQGFSKSFGITFLDKNSERKTPWQISWGFSTRLIGGVAMVHGDDKGLVLPPKIAPAQAVIIPITFGKDSKEVLQKSLEIKNKLSKSIRVELDSRETYTPGWKFNEWELKGTPIRIEIGPRDIAKKQVVVARRDTGKKQAVKTAALSKKIEGLLEEIQESMLEKARKALQSRTAKPKTWAEAEKAIKDKKMVLMMFCGKEECEDMIKDRTGGASARCSPFEQPKKPGKCLQCGKQAGSMTYFSRAY